MKADPTTETSVDLAAEVRSAPDGNVAGVGGLERSAWALRFGVVPILVLSGVVIVGATSDRPAGVVVLVVGFGVVAALILADLLAGFAALLRSQSRRDAALDRLDARLADGFERLAAALERAKLGPAGPSIVALETARQLTEIRRAIRSGDWDAAGSLVRDFGDAHPDDPDAGRLAAELADARTSAASEIRAKVDAARGANDPERVIELRDALRPLLAAEALHDLDRDLAKWFLLSIHRKLLSRTVSADLAALAARVGATLDGTPEGASLRAALPTLRRAAGLCARCAQPYLGVETACPVCLGTAATPVGLAAIAALEAAAARKSADEAETPAGVDFNDVIGPDD